VKPAVLTRYLIALTVAALLIAVPAAVAPTLSEVCAVAQSEEANRLSDQRTIAGLVVLVGSFISFGVAVATQVRGRRTGWPPGMTLLGLMGVVMGVIGLAAWFVTGIVFC
jgi:hypothetical protein